MSPDLTRVARRCRRHLTALGLAVATLWLAGPPPSAAEIDRDAFEEARLRNKIPQPQTLEEFEEQVRLLKELGADTAEIAEHVSKVVDRRLQASNRPWGESLFNPLRRGEQADLRRRWEAIDRDRGVVPNVKPIPDGEQYVTTARLAWENRVGNCGESAQLAYYVLHRAGIDAHVLNSGAGGGHEFTVIGVSPGFDANDPSTWGPGARVVDGWMGKSLTAEEAAANRFIKGMAGNALLTEFTGSLDNPRQHDDWVRMGVRGVVEVVVTGPEGPLGGATVTLAGEEGQSATTTAQGIARFVSYPGSSSVEVTPPEGSELLASSAGVTVETRQIVTVPVALEEDKNVAVTYSAVVVDAQTNGPIGGATVSGAESGPAETDASGKVDLRGRKGSGVTLTATASGYDEGGGSGPVARGGTIVIRLALVHCQDAGDMDACKKTMGGFCPCQRKKACGMTSCLYDAGQGAGAPTRLAGSGSWRGSMYTGTGSVAIDLQSGALTGSIVGNSEGYRITGSLDGTFTGDHLSGRVKGSYTYSAVGSEDTFSGGGTFSGTYADGVLSGSFEGDDSGGFTIPVTGR